ncbi:ethanolamine ammonia-lyase reactivating factor EutA [Pseudoramibacter sp.]|jgi:ethanolamine utilization protein EutA|uniref:ethanolamine ammonia-lyase reactivating factor EutA n=1 Tax=Pseudoramibacter sp. TaxID=2034862 RepID=UPI0025DB3ACC|nr:ethanolamine ammonia-lyase reactivating factor EutA [Pseudoramibacter sp.]MCH4071396.1 ethanolamine ammonia-lyase reactivating factor EutA [Pseudoramibacter sp.]MCH4105164.1 ethanolamine ammonia-lyase reactivating factor EutA [Pseudoramibacter sp.]
MSEKIKSVGIDIGTSTTQLIFSELTIRNLAGSYRVPRIKIVDKRVIYKSAIYFTPLQSMAAIDTAAVKAIMQKEYQKAGIKPEDLQTGAVIITGDSARKDNADSVIEELSDMAGDFVVATAGPDLESVLSARGAGTDVLSREQEKTIANIDIGGGTSNIAVYQNGRLMGTSCLNIGGRLITVEEGRIKNIFPDLERRAEKMGQPIHRGDQADVEKLKKICRQLASDLAQALNLKPREAGHDALYTNGGDPLDTSIHLDGITFSGGVAACLYEHPSGSFPYGDIGNLLAQAVREEKAFSTVETYPSRETIRATVVGAGSHTMNVSGSTIRYEAGLLPIKNIPVLKIREEDEDTPGKITQTIQREMPVLLGNGETSPVAIALSAQNTQTFAEIQTLAQTIVDGTEKVLKRSAPLIVITENDIGKVLGNALSLLVGREHPVISLDGLYADTGDYIDIGEPVAGGRVCPVIIKTIVFNS